MGDFNAVAELLDYPMFVVTTAYDGDAAGCLVGFTTQVSINPPRQLVGLSNKNRTHDVALRARRLVVHVLDAESTALARLFGEATGDDVDKFALCSWQPGEDGVPVLDEAAAWFSGVVVDRLDGGDHTAFLIDVDAADVRCRPARVLQLSDVGDFDPGHEA